MSLIEKILVFLLPVLAVKTGKVVTYPEANGVGACSFPLGHYTTGIASVHKSLNPQKCGVCLQVTFNGKSKKVRIVDSFTENEVDKLQLDQATFKELGLEEGKSEVTYEEVACSEDMAALFDVDGSSQDWAQFVVVDHPAEIASVHYYGESELIEIKRNGANTFTYPKGENHKVISTNIKVEDINGDFWILDGKNPGPGKRHGGQFGPTPQEKVEGYTTEVDTDKLAKIQGVGYTNAKKNVADLANPTNIYKGQVVAQPPSKPYAGMKICVPKQA